MAFLGGSTVKNLPAMQETWVQSLGWDDPLEEEGPGNPLLQERTPWIVKPARLQSIGSHRVGHA